MLAQILEKYQGKLTYVNVRVPTRPAYRLVDSDDVGQGSGVTEKGAAQDKSASDDGGSGTSASGQDGTQGGA